MQDYEYFLSSINNIKGIGKKTAKLFLKKKILNIFDLLWHMPISKIETSNTVNIDELQIGKIQSIFFPDDMQLTLFGRFLILGKLYL